MKLLYKGMKYLLMIMMMGLISTNLMAQNNSKKITGTVFEQGSNLLLTGANITLVGAQKGTSTGLKGTFELSGLSSQEYELKVSYLGYESKTIMVDLRSVSSQNIEVRLSPDVLELSEVKVQSDAQIDRVNVISQVDIKMRPVDNSQDVLRVVPGLMTGQHAGGGKAEQIFLRGFDIDHGTDINISVDGMPVNMVSHAHGQGYSDLHFVIPETIERVDFDKGPYYADKGNFTTAGYASFQTKRALNKSSASFEGGQFDSYRGTAMVNLFNSTDGKTHAYVAGEYLNKEGFFLSDQDFTRLNLFGKYSTQISPNVRLTASASTFESEWTASGQIPVRAVNSGQISRFGAIDDTEGGTTSRTNANLQLDHFVGENTLIEHQAYYINYDFKLFSNFTFFLDDPVNGDQIRQTENRNVFGYKGSAFFDGELGNMPLKSTVGAGFRYDDVNDIRLSETRDRSQTLNDLARGQVNELNAFAYVNEEISLNSKLSLNPGIRLDFFNSKYKDELQPGDPTLEEQKVIVSPKLNVEYRFSEQAKIYAKTGMGFHSNDSRAVVARNGRQILPKAYGADLGFTAKLSNRLIINPVVWVLHLEEEFVYVGDGGVVEPSGRSRRLGADLSVRYQMLDWLYADLDLNYTYARSLDAPDGQDRIPLAPKLTSIAGLSFDFANGLNGSLRYRAIGDRPANEDNSITAEGYFVVDAVLNYTWNQFEVGLSAQNLFDTQWKETQFAYESQLRNESAPVNEIHFTPGTPFNAKATFSVFF